MVKAILFDFGGVFMDSPFDALDEQARIMGVEGVALRDIVFGDYHRDSDHPWHQLERGEIDLEVAREAIVALGKEQQLDTDIYNLLAAFAQMQRGLRQPLLDAIYGWRDQGLRLGIITNNIKEFSHWKDLFPFAVDEVFDTVIDSSAVGVRKPAAEIYQLALQDLDLQEEDVLFLDDFAGNVTAAEELGIRSFLVTPDIDLSIAWVNQRIQAVR
jgi:epoxide hydrolase-like predicted phosphatase